MTYFYLAPWAHNKKYVDTIVYSEKSGGSKDWFLPKSKVWGNLKKLLGIERIFCMAVFDFPDEYGRKQEGGKYFITSWYCVDPIAYKQYKDALNFLFETIRSNKIKKIKCLKVEN